jgi:hypothetical protein
VRRSGAAPGVVLRRLGDHVVDEAGVERARAQLEVVAVPTVVALVEAAEAIEGRALAHERVAVERVHRFEREVAVVPGRCVERELHGVVAALQQGAVARQATVPGTSRDLARAAAEAEDARARQSLEIRLEPARVEVQARILVQERERVARLRAAAGDERVVRARDRRRAFDRVQPMRAGVLVEIRGEFAGEGAIVDRAEDVEHRSARAGSLARSRAASGSAGRAARRGRRRPAASCRRTPS